MVKLFCALVGVKGSVFSVKIDANESVDELKDKIAEKQKYEFAASKLQLFLARTASGAWLTDDDQAAMDLKDGKVDNDLIKMMREQKNKIKTTKTLHYWLFEKNSMPQLTTDEIHVLVVVPKQGTLSPPVSSKSGVFEPCAHPFFSQFCDNWQRWGLA
ncbi:hypothetical protein PsorP6_005847 [Peronosclerospora sorghi]|uniref:Uncharacterized protein n=1 Tax=Peronosclerospora sorghi TaxID=230839 RepID=A0ACC0W324_9STRA|nr:hypothetical protein PsorP6_005847 [Peronosclerospora sorghi]